MTTPDAREVFADPRVAALAEAAAAGRRDGVERLVADGVDPDAAGEQGVTPLMWAVVHRSGAGAAALLASGADPARRDANGRSAVHVAAMMDDPAPLQAMIESGVDLDMKAGRLDRSPIFEAIASDRDATFRALIDAGANLDARDDAGSTPLHFAAQVGDYGKLLGLLEAGADPLARDRGGNTFQRYFAISPPASRLTAEARDHRARIEAWLQENGVPREAMQGERTMR